MGAARVRVTLEVLRHALSLPPQTDIRHISMTDAWTAELTVRHPDIPGPDEPRREGEQVPLASPSFRHNEPVTFLDWGIKP